MAFFDATKKINTSKLPELDLLQGRNFGVNEDDYLFVRVDNITITLIGTYKLDPETSLITGGKLKGIEVTKKGLEVWKLSDIDVKLTDFLDAVNSDQIEAYIQSTLFNGDDTLEGSFRADKLYGFNHDDSINGYGGKDKIYGGKGNDKLWGYTGEDAFVFDSKLNATYNVDKIKDWNFKKNQGGGEDEIWLDSDIFKAFKGMEGDYVTKKNFNVGKTSETDDHYLIYNPNTGRLFYDPDGHGGESKILFADVAKEPKMTPGDFLII